MKLGLVVLALAAVPHLAFAQTVTWEAVALVSPGRQLLGSGVKKYVPERDIVVTERAPTRSGSPGWSKSLALDETFSVSVAVYREPALTGFGVEAVRRGDANGFSWEWFDRDEGDVFSRLQGPGRVAVSVQKGAGYEELVAIEFLEDVVLRYLDDMCQPPGTHTHEVVIRKGSVLRLAP